MGAKAFFGGLWRGVKAGVGLSNTPVGSAILAGTGAGFLIPVLRVSSRAVVLAEEAYRGARDKSAEKALIAASHVSRDLPDMIAELNKAFGRAPKDMTRLENACGLANELSNEILHAYGVFESASEEKKENPPNG